MSQKQMIIVTLMISCTIICSAKNIRSSELPNLEKNPVGSDWLKPKKTKDLGRALYWPAHSSENAMKRASCKMLYAVKTFPKSKNIPIYYMELCHNLTELQEDRLAIYWIKRFQQLPEIENLPARGHWMTEIKKAGLKGRYLLLKIYARNKLEKEALALISQLHPKIPKEYLMIAEAYAVMGMKEKALQNLKHCISSGRHLSYKGPPGPMNPGWIMDQKATTRASAAVLALGLGDLELAKKIAKPVVNDNLLKNHKWTSRRISWTILNDIYHSRNSISLKNLKDGVYEGRSRGYVDEIEVAVTVKNGRIADVKVTYNSENRPYNAIQVIPLRMQKYNSIAVDAVSGATVSSSGLSVAVYRALLEGIKQN